MVCSSFHILAIMPTQLSLLEWTDQTIIGYCLLLLAAFAPSQHEEVFWNQDLFLQSIRFVWLRRSVSLPTYLRFETLKYFHASSVSKLKLELRILLSWTDSFKYLKSSWYVRRRVDCNEICVHSLLTAAVMDTVEGSYFLKMLDFSSPPLNSCFNFAFFPLVFVRSKTHYFLYQHAMYGKTYLCCRLLFRTDKLLEDENIFFFYMLNCLVNTYI